MLVSFTQADLTASIGTTKCCLITLVSSQIADTKNMSNYNCETQENIDKINAILFCFSIYDFDNQDLNCNTADEIYTLMNVSRSICAC